MTVRNFVTEVLVRSSIFRTANKLLFELSAAGCKVSPMHAFQTIATWSVMLHQTLMFLATSPTVGTYELFVMCYAISQHMLLPRKPWKYTESNPHWMVSAASKLWSTLANDILHQVSKPSGEMLFSARLILIMLLSARLPTLHMPS